MSFLIKLLFFALTAVIAGVVPTLLFFSSAADRRVFIVGGIATAASYIPIMAGLPAVARVTVGSTAFYPLWAIALAFPIALFWRLAAGLSRPPVTPEERATDIQRKAREKAARYRRDS